MSRLTGWLVALATVTNIALVAGMVPARAANADVGYMQGFGTAVPGLGLLPQPQAYGFNGTLTVVGTSSVGGSYSCNLQGGSNNPLGDAIGFGMGTMRGGCGPICLGVIYVRVGAVEFLVGGPGCGGETSGAVGVCEIVPDDTLPTTTFSQACPVIMAGLSTNQQAEAQADCDAMPWPSSVPPRGNFVGVQSEPSTSYPDATSYKVYYEGGYCHIIIGNSNGVIYHGPHYHPLDSVDIS